MLPELRHEEMYQALLQKDASYEGLFFVGVKTTGIFCRPTCRARKPKFENTDFFKSVKEALDQGYRPCKICHPLEINQNPEWYQNLLTDLNNDPALVIRDRDLRARHLDPVTVRRWFLKNFGFTFQAFQRYHRINHAFGNLKGGKKIPDAAYDHGFESLSGFGEAFKKVLGFSPAKSSLNTVLTYERIITPLGPMMAVTHDKGICLLEFTDRRMLETQLKRLQKYFGINLIPGTHPLLDQLKEELIQYFEGRRTTFSVPLIFPGSDFQVRVWKILQSIPCGSTRSYAEQALKCGNIQAVRAVAKANGDNRIAILIPCHRVIASDGSLTGYGGGLWRKKWLLDHEKEMIEKLRKG